MAPHVLRPFLSFLASLRGWPRERRAGEQGRAEGSLVGVEELRRQVRVAEWGFSFVGVEELRRQVRVAEWGFSFVGWPLVRKRGRLAEPFRWPLARFELVRLEGWRPLGRPRRHVVLEERQRLRSEWCTRSPAHGRRAQGARGRCPPGASNPARRRRRTSAHRGTLGRGMGRRGLRARRRPGCHRAGLGTGTSGSPAPRSRGVLRTGRCPRIPARQPTGRATGDGLRGPRP